MNLHNNRIHTFFVFGIGDHYKINWVLITLYYNLLSDFDRNQPLFYGTKWYLITYRKQRTVIHWYRSLRTVENRRMPDGSSKPHPWWPGNRADYGFLNILRLLFLQNYDFQWKFMAFTNIFVKLSLWAHVKLTLLRT